MIALNCEEPWNCAKELRLWIDVLMEVLEEHMKELPLETQDKLRDQSILLYYKLSYDIHKEI